MTKTPLKAEDMDITGNLFGIRIVDRPGGQGYPDQPKSIVELYIEVDENYHLKAEFHVFWLKDLQNVINQATQQFGRDTP